MSKNIYLSESERRLMSIGITRTAQRLMSSRAGAGEETPRGLLQSDLTLSRTFRRGYLGMEAEQRLRLLSEEAEAAGAMVQPEEAERAEESSEAGEAVVDEDML